LIKIQTYAGMQNSITAARVVEDIISRMSVNSVSPWQRMRTHLQ